MSIKPGGIAASIMDKGEKQQQNIEKVKKS
jgi:hypothetical protein